MRKSLFILALIYCFISCKNSSSTKASYKPFVDPIHKIDCKSFVNLLDTSQIYEPLRPEDSYLKTRVNIYFEEGGITWTARIAENNIRCQYKERDMPIWKDPCVEFFFDPKADGLNYYELQVNAFPQVWDLKLKSSAPPVNDEENVLPWDTGSNFGYSEWRGTLNDSTDLDKFWGVVGTIDWDDFEEGKPKKGDVWAYNIMWVEYDKNDNPTYWVAKSTGKQNIHHPETWPVFTF